jgi:hypothetical protein
MAPPIYDNGRLLADRTSAPVHLHPKSDFTRLEQERMQGAQRGGYKGKMTSLAWNAIIGIDFRNFQEGN